MFKNIQPYLDKVVLVSKPSVFAAKLFEDNFFDFVYIDADHTYDAITADLEAWYPKVKSNGILSSHDAQGGEVYAAINDFAEKHQLRLTEDIVAPTHGNDLRWRNKVYIGKNVDSKSIAMHVWGDFVIIK